jgi:hypothetical protein
MHIKKIAGVVAAAWVLAGMARPAHAQFGAFPVNLPKDDFTWNWGNLERSKDRRFTDFMSSGSEEGFRCTLEGKLSAGSRMAPSDIRQLENDLSTSLYFIEAAVDAMNTLDYERQLDWATLDCDKPEPTEADAAKTQASLEKAKAKAVKKLIERREKREREEAKAQGNAAEAD